jgi:SpoVK/Ycf46/Vps4 family AAA+-type ATPase
VSFGQDAVKALKDALSLSPNNTPLRKHLAATLVSLGRFAEAEHELREALLRDPNDQPLKEALADAFYRQGKNSESLALVETLVKDPSASAVTFVLYARLLSAAGDHRTAKAMYQRAIDMDPTVEDAELSDRFDIHPKPEPSSVDFDEDDDSDSRQRAAWEAPTEPPELLAERPKITFADVGGMDEVKEEVRLKIIYPLTHAEMYKAYGKAIGGGILLFGPPGCGKTHLARAAAGEIKASFLAVGINDVLDMWIGNSEKNLHALFEQARSKAPCVLFFDEVDALGAARADLRHGGGRQLVNQFLSEMDGIDSSNEGVLVLAATNAPWQLDSAFRRPGRFDRIVFVPPPDEPARAEILRILAKDKPTDRLDFQQLAKRTKDFSGADLKAVLDRAIETKLREAMKDGKLLPLKTKDLLEAAKGVRPSTADWFGSARNHALYANQSGLYDDVLKYLKIK